MEANDKIKKALKHCGSGEPCPGCPLWDECKEIGGLQRLFDGGLSLVNELEDRNAELLTKVKQLETKCHQLEQERDAAIKELESVYNPCDFCKHGQKLTYEAPCNLCKHCFSLGEKSMFEWRGAKQD